MAIKGFATSNISTNDYSLYSNGTFNGIDTTSVPSLVEDTRATKMSNYLPLGNNSLGKRNGFKVVKKYKYNNREIELIKYREFKDMEINSTYSIGLVKIDSNYRLFYAPKGVYELNDTNLIGNASLDLDYLETFEYDNHIFILALGDYFVYKDGILVKVKDYSYIPTTIVNYPAVKQLGKSMVFEEYNVLSNKFKVKLQPYIFEDDKTLYYDLSEILSMQKNAKLVSLNGVPINSYFNDKNYVTVMLDNGVLVERKFLSDGTKIAICNKDYRDNRTYESWTLNTWENVKAQTSMSYSIYRNKDWDEEERWDAYFNAKELVDAYNEVMSQTPTSNKKIFLTYGNDLKNTYISEAEAINKIYNLLTFIGTENLDVHALSFDDSPNKKRSTIKIDEAPYIEYGDIDYELEPTYNYELVAELQYDSEEYVSNMRFGTTFGTNGYKNRLFLSGNPDKPNLDWHTADIKAEPDLNTTWISYTYFGDSCFETFGSSNKAITGYGLLNNGNMVIFKQSEPNQSNVFIRTPHNDANQLINADNSSSYVEKFIEYYTTTNSVISVSSEIPNQVIQFNNELLFNTPTGIYRVDLTANTASQGYIANEVSYFIRNDLGSDISNSSFTVLDNKLYISRKDKNGVMRVYVADANRQSVVNGHYQYEWWVLDDLDVNTLLIMNNKLHFTNSYGLCTFKDDTDKFRFGDSILLDYTNSSSGVYKYNSNLLNASASNPKTSFIEYIERDFDNKELTLKRYKEFMIYTENIRLNNTNDSYRIKMLYCFAKTEYDTVTSRLIPINEVKVEGNNLYWVGANNDKWELIISDEIHFNYFSLEKKDTTEDETKWIDADLSNYERISFEFLMPINSYWYSKYNALGRLDYLKSARNISFLPDNVRGGLTKVGYSTAKTDAMYNTNSLRSEVDFNEIDFDEFDFGVKEFARTYSSKKKIKNFSFLQFIFVSDDPKDSTIVAYSFKYKLSKQNKGVR